MFTIKHYFREGLITLSIEYFKINQDDALLYNHSHVRPEPCLVTTPWQPSHLVPRTTLPFRWSSWSVWSQGLLTPARVTASRSERRKRRKGNQRKM
jgi:hypothetical protein